MKLSKKKEDNRRVIFGRISPENHAFICSEIAGKNQFLNNILDEALRAARVKGRYRLGVRVSKAIEVMKQQNAKRMKKYADRKQRKS